MPLTCVYVAIFEAGAHPVHIVGHQVMSIVEKHQATTDAMGKTLAATRYGL
ncbi:hypothetical protein [Streptacidiphilus sp. EB129]|uniref:hypothetical protein n=1 Tax=Streptacidiphilus sp. EB129 TaxID=3156262 RepID=UPI0035118E07